MFAARLPVAIFLPLRILINETPRNVLRFVVIWPGCALGILRGLSRVGNSAERSHTRLANTALPKLSNPMQHAVVRLSIEITKISSGTALRLHGAGAGGAGGPAHLAEAADAADRVVEVTLACQPWSLRLRSPFGTSHSTTTQRTNALVHVIVNGVQGM